MRNNNRMSFFNSTKFNFYKTYIFVIPFIFTNLSQAIDLYVIDLEKRQYNYVIITVIKDIVAKKNIDVIDKFLHDGNDINMSHGIDGCTFLWLAFHNSMRFDPDFAQKLVDRGADVNISCCGETLLFNAVRAKDLVQLKFLLKNNVNLLVKNSQGRNVFEVAQQMLKEQLELLDTFLPEDAKFHDESDTDEKVLLSVNHLLSCDELKTDVESDLPYIFKVQSYLGGYYSIREMLDCLENHFLHR